MKLKHIILSAAALILSAAPAFAQQEEAGMSRTKLIDNVNKSGDIGVGAQAGTFSGLNMENWLSNSRAFTAALTFQSDNTALSLDHRWFARHEFSGSARAIAPYIGAGAVGVFGNNNDNFDRTASLETFALAAQAPLGLEYLPEAQRFSAFAEIVPGVEVTPVALGVLSADVGARLYF